MAHLQDLLLSISQDSPLEGVTRSRMVGGIFNPHNFKFSNMGHTPMRHESHLSHFDRFNARKALRMILFNVQSAVIQYIT